MSHSESAESSSVALAHIGIAVADLAAACSQFEKLFGVSPSPMEEVETEGVRVVHFELANCTVELLEGTKPDSPIRKFLDGGRRGVHHVAFRPDERGLDRTLKSLTDSGVRVLSDEPRTGSNGTRVFFVHPRDAGGTLVEFVEAPDNTEAHDRPAQ